MRVSAICFLGLGPAALLAAFLAVALTGHHSSGTPAAIDFHTIWEAGKAYLHGRNPYPANLKDFVGDGPRQSFVYPAATAALVAPLSALPYTLAVSLFVPLSALTAAFALWILGVREWRCYGVAFASPAVLTGISIGTLSPLLLLGCALAWRYRDSMVRCSLAVAAVLVLKLFLWPLLLWLLVTGRRRTSVLAVTLATVVSIAAWSPIGFAGIRDYPDLLHRLGLIEGPRGYGIAALFTTHAGAVLVVLLLASVAVAATALTTRAGRPDSRSFVAAIGVSLLLSPILWLHYLVLLPMVIALRRPRLGALWFVPLALWFTPHQGSYGATWRVAFVGVVAAVALAGSTDRLRQLRALTRRRTAAPARGAGESL